MLFSSKKKCCLLFFGICSIFLSQTAIGQSSITKTQEVYESPYCSNNGLTHEEHFAIEHSKKVNFLYAAIIKDDSAFKEKLDRYAEITCMFKGDPDLEKQNGLMEEYLLLKSTIKTIKREYVE